MNNTTFEIVARFHAAPPVADWREQLAARLGSRPRRIGVWAELALHGALECLAAAQEGVLPAEANILVASRRGPLAATRAVLEQGRDDLPMPLTFLQTQPSQMLAVLGEHLGWVGEACFVGNCSRHEVLRLAAAQCSAAGVLIGWVDEMEKGATSWLRLRPCDQRAGGIRPAARDEEIFSPGLTHLRIPGNDEVE